MSPRFLKGPGSKLPLEWISVSSKSHGEKPGLRLLRPSRLQLRLSKPPGLLHRDPQLRSSQTRPHDSHLPAALLQAGGLRRPFLPGESAPSGVSLGLTSTVESSAYHWSSVALFCILSGISPGSSVHSPRDCGQGPNPSRSQSPGL